MQTTPSSSIGAGLALLLALGLSACGGGGGSTPPVGPVNTDVKALAASQPGELLAYVKTKLADRQLQRSLVPDAIFLTGVPIELAVSPAAAASPDAARSGTTVQEAGVDEDDLIKTDGNVIYTLVRTSDPGTGKSSGKVNLQRRRADGSLDAATAVVLPSSADSFAQVRGLYLAASAQRVAVLGESQVVFDYCSGTRPCPALSVLPYPPMATQSSVVIDMVDVSNASAPATLPRISIDGRLVGSRLIGNLLYVVTQHSPQLAIDALPASATEADRQALITRMAATDVLPTIRIGTGAAQPLLPETDCYVQAKNASLGLEVTAVTVFNLQSSTGQRASRCFIGGVEALYMSNTTLYLATTRYNYDASAPNIRFAPQTSTDIHKFALSGLVIDYRGSGTVDGHLGWDWEKRSYRMSEWNGDLRVLTFTGETGWVTLNNASDPKLTPSPATLTVLREQASDKSLQTVGKLPNAQRTAAIGKPNEQVYAVRLLGNRGYVVTFRRSDPLYVLDLSVPTDPKTVGELMVAGFSDYLFPITDGLLLGVGKDANDKGVVGGVKAALFDVSNPAKPTQTDSKVFGERGSVSGLDYGRHGIDMLARGNVTRVGLPLFVANSNFASSQRGLQRLEIDTTAKTFNVKPMLKAGALTQDLSGDRSVQIGEQVYYFADGTVTAANW